MFVTFEQSHYFNGMHLARIKTQKNLLKEIEKKKLKNYLKNYAIAPKHSSLHINTRKYYSQNFTQTLIHTI